MAQRLNQKMTRPGVTKIAFLAPLSGKSAALGQAMLNAAQLAVFDIGGDGFEMMPRDTKGTPAGAVTAVREALSGGAHLIIGPLFATNVAAVKPELEGKGVSMLALSTDVSLAEPGLYVMGFAPTPQVRRVVSFALSRGIKKFAALIPAGPYGDLVSGAFEEAVRAGGGDVVFLGHAQEAAALVQHKEHIQALFLPFADAGLTQILAQLQQAGFEKGNIRLLGTGLWDVPHFAAAHPGLMGGWYAASEPEPRLQFIKAYKETYGQEPPRLTTLAYDATALAAVLVRKGLVIDKEVLTNPSGFAGLDGVFRLLDNGEIERGLAVNELTEEGSTVIDPSPSSFVGR